MSKPLLKSSSNDLTAESKMYETTVPLLKASSNEEEKSLSVTGDDRPLLLLVVEHDRDFSDNNDIELNSSAAGRTCHHHRDDRAVVDSHSGGWTSPGA